MSLGDVIEVRGPTCRVVKDSAGTHTIYAEPFTETHYMGFRYVVENRFNDRMSAYLFTGGEDLGYFIYRVTGTGEETGKNTAILDYPGIPLNLSFPRYRIKEFTQEDMLLLSFARVERFANYILPIDIGTI